MKKMDIYLLTIFIVLSFGLYVRLSLGQPINQASDKLDKKIESNSNPEDTNKAELEARAYSPEAAQLVPCTSTISDKPTKYPGWSTNLYTAKLTDKSTNNGVITNGITNFSIQGLIDKTEPNSLYFRIQRTNYPSDPIIGAKFVFEICDANNQTPSWYSTTMTTMPVVSEKIASRTLYLHANSRILKPGTYRIDAYIYVDQSWHLTDRLNSISLSD